MKRRLTILIQWITWWCWRRWRIYCPRKPVSHLFDQKRRLVMTPYGLMEFPSREEFETALFHYDEAFVFPCSLNVINCGGVQGKWTPKIGMLRTEPCKEP